MSNDSSNPQPPPHEQPAQPSEAAAPKKIEVEAQPTSGASSAGRVYDAPPPGWTRAGAPPPSNPPPHEPPPNPFLPPDSPLPPPAGRSRAWPVAVHLIGLLDFGVKFFCAGLIATLVMWLMKRGDDPEIDFHGKESLNLQLNILFWQIVAIPFSLCLIGIPVLLLAPLVQIIMLIVGAVHASDGERWRYPFVFRLIR
ncbi:MAG: DUF4870 domain-containing protein [Planctomycetes bacterium]|nr:DUF4870 domain-containing protein [Planctomycetota bacterium]